MRRPAEQPDLEPWHFTVTAADFLFRCPIKGSRRSKEHPNVLRYDGSNSLELARVLQRAFQRAAKEDL